MSPATLVYPAGMRHDDSLCLTEEPAPVDPGAGLKPLESLFTESLILAQDERWRRA